MRKLFDKVFGNQDMRVRDTHEHTHEKKEKIGREGSGWVGLMRCEKKGETSVGGGGGGIQKSSDQGEAWGPPSRPTTKRGPPTIPCFFFFFPKLHSSPTCLLTKPHSLHSTIFFARP